MFVFNVAADGSSTVHAPTTETIPNGHDCWPECRRLTNARGPRFHPVEASVNCKKCLAALAAQEAEQQALAERYAMESLIHPGALDALAEAIRNAEMLVTTWRNWAAKAQSDGHGASARKFMADADRHQAIADSLKTIRSMAAALVAAEQARR